MQESIHENDVVAMLTDLPQEDLRAGDTGAVVHVHGNGEAFEVEFPSARDNGMGGVVTVERVHLLKLRNLAARLAS